MHVTSKGLRDLFFLLVGSAVLYHEVWQRQEPSPLGVFVALFLYGLIPAFRADDGSAPGPLALIAQAMAGLGAKAPQAPEGKAEPEARVAPEAVARMAGLEGPAAPEGLGEPPNGGAHETRTPPASDGSA